MAFVMAAIVGTILSMTEVDAQSTVDDSESCESSTLDEAVDLIRHGMNNVGLIREELKAVTVIREDLEGVKKVLGSILQQNNESSIKKDLEELKTAFDALAKQQNNALSAVKKELEDLKVAFNASVQPQNDISSTCNKDLEDLNSAFNASSSSSSSS